MSELTLPTFEAQSELVEGIQPVPKRVRFRRHVAPTEVAVARPPPPYDLRGTPEEAEWDEQKAIIERNLQGSDWEPEAAEDKIRLVYRDENHDEWEEEYDRAELEALRRLGEERGIIVRASTKRHRPR